MGTYKPKQGPSRPPGLETYAYTMHIHNPLESSENWKLWTTRDTNLTLPCWKNQDRGLLEH